MNTPQFPRLAALTAALLIFEAVYFSTAGPGVIWFIPELALVASGLIGLLLGPRAGIGWGAATGFVQEIFFLSPEGVFGAAPIAYAWCAALGGWMFFGRAQTGRPALGAVAAAGSLAVGHAVALVVGPGQNFLSVSGPAGPWLVSWGIETAAGGPLLLALLRRWFALEGGEAVP